MSSGRLSWWLLGAAVSATIAVAAGGAQAAGGELDPTFGHGGKVTTDLGTKTYDEVAAVAVQKDGKILVAGSRATGSFDAGWSRQRFALVRYTAGGKLDATFGRGGKAVTDFGTQYYGAEAVAVQADGKIVAAGVSDTKGGEGFALVRYTSSGKLDATFGHDGKVLTTFGAESDEEAHGVAVQKDGKIVVAGISNAIDEDDFALVRYTTSGKLDTSFGKGGKVLTTIGTNSDDGAEAVAVQADGKIVVVGYSDANGNYRFALVRYTTSGKLDASFGRGGKVLADLGGGDQPASAVVQQDGKIVVAGSNDAGGSGGILTYNLALVRYTTSGKLDASFGRGGKVLADLGGGDQPTSAAVLQDGKIVVASSGDAGGSTDSTDFALVRYTTGGKLDATFGSDGKVLTTFGAESDDEAHAVAVQKDGQIVVAGTTRDARQRPRLRTRPLHEIDQRRPSTCAWRPALAALRRHS